LVATPRDYEFRKARRVVRLLAREQDPPWKVRQLKDRLREAGLDPNRAFVELRKAKVIKTDYVFTRTENELWCRPGPGADAVPTGPEFADAFVVIDQRLAIKDQRQEWFASTTFQLNGRIFQSETPWRLGPVSGDEPLHKLMTALDSDAVVDPEVLEVSQESLRAALFAAGTGAAQAVTDLLAAGRAVRIRLHVGGDLARLPWEATAHPDGSPQRLMIEDEQLALVRLAGAGRPLMAAGGAPAVDYACLYPELDHEDIIKSALTAAGWPVPRRWDPAEFLAPGKPAGPPGGIVHLVAHAERRPALHTRGPGACALRVAGPSSSKDIRARDLVTAVLAHAPALAVLAICWSGFEGGLTTSLARELAAGGVPSVVAMRGRAERAALREFFRAFYTALGEGYGLERAMHDGRMAVAGHRLQRLQFVLVQRGEAGTLAG
jgi:hypothetical protein